MRLTARPTDALTSEPTVMMNSDDCLNIGVGPNDRVRITGRGSAVTTVLISDTIVPKGTVIMPLNEMERCGVSDGDEVDVDYSPMSLSVRSDRKSVV